MIGKVASTIGTAPRSPAQETKTCSRTGIPNGAEHNSTETGRATSVRPTPRRGRGAAPHQVGLGRPASPTARTARSGRARRVLRRSRWWRCGGEGRRCPAVVRPRRPRRTGCRRPPRRRRSRAWRRPGWPADRDRSREGRGGEHPASRVGDSEPDRCPDQHLLEETEEGDDGIDVVPHVGDHQGHQDDHRRVIEAGLGLEVARVEPAMEACASPRTPRPRRLRTPLPRARRRCARRRRAAARPASR